MSETIINLTAKFWARQSSFGSTNKPIGILKQKYQTANEIQGKKQDKQDKVKSQ